MTITLENPTQRRIVFKVDGILVSLEGKETKEIDRSSWEWSEKKELAK